MTAADLLLVAAVALLAATTTLPVVATALEHERSMTAARYLWMRLHEARLAAVHSGRHVAVRLTMGADTCLQAFADGNGNGVLSRDIDEGVDRSLGPVDCLGAHVRGAGLRVNQPVADIGEAGWLSPGAPPLRIGRTNLVSFGPSGSTTAGTLYLAAERGPQYAIRLTGASGRLRLLRFDPGSASWRP